MPPLRNVRPLLLAGLATGALVLVTELRVPRAGESLALRWARTAAAHPLRTGLALALLGLALSPARRYEEGP